MTGTPTSDPTTSVARGLPAGAPAPQPVGALPWPAGLLVLPRAAGEADEVASAAHAAMLVGEGPDQVPDAWQFVVLALDGDTEAAAAALASSSSSSEPWARYDRAVLVGGDDAFDGLLDLDDEVGALARVAAFSVGLVDDVPEPFGLAGEVEGVVRSARASQALERGDAVAALGELDLGAVAAEAAGATLLAGTLRSNRAELLREALGEAAAAVAEADAALAVLPAEAVLVRAEVLLCRALARQELAGDDRPQLVAAVADLNEALTVLTEEDHPLLWATAQQHLSLAYLVMPMSDQGDRIRIGVAVAGLRSALRVLTPEEYPVAWASAQVNLANALQYLPSAHQQENLDEAVQLYEEVLARRDPRADPVGYARTLANQGTALGHLGVLSDARLRLEQARDIFVAVGDDDALAGVEESLASLAEAEDAAAVGEA